MMRLAALSTSSEFFARLVLRHESPVETMARTNMAWVNRRGTWAQMLARLRIELHRADSTAAASALLRFGNQLRVSKIRAAKFANSSNINI